MTNETKPVNELLTLAEREALEFAVDMWDHDGSADDFHATLSALLHRGGGPVEVASHHSDGNQR